MNSKYNFEPSRNLSENLRWYGAAAFGAFPLDMSQYKSLFGSSRIPQKGKDRHLHCADSKHFIVLRGGKIYSVDLFDRYGMLLMKVSNSKIA